MVFSRAVFIFFIVFSGLSWADEDIGSASGRFLGHPTYFLYVANQTMGQCSLDEHMQARIIRDQFKDFPLIYAKEGPDNADIDIQLSIRATPKEYDGRTVCIGAIELQVIQSFENRLRHNGMEVVSQFRLFDRIYVLMDTPDKLLSGIRNVSTDLFEQLKSAIAKDINGIK